MNTLHRNHDATDAPLPSYPGPRPLNRVAALGMAALLPALPPALGETISSGFVPQLVDAQLSDLSVIEGFHHEAVEGLNYRFPFWTDILDVEQVSETGEGVYVAILDTGLLRNWRFLFPGGNIASELGKGFTHDVWWDEQAGEIVYGPLRDDRGFITELASGHGTAVTSMVTGYRLQRRWYDGVAPHATIIPVLVGDGWVVDVPQEDGSVERVQWEDYTDPMLVAGIDYVTELSDSLDGPVIISMSLGGPKPSPLVEAAIARAIEKGVIVVAAAGNYGSDGLAWPAAYPGVISAGAAGWTEMFGYGWQGFQTDAPEQLHGRDLLGNSSHLYLANFSSRPNHHLGQKRHDLDVVAPGRHCMAPYKRAFVDGPDTYDYYFLSGTSMSAPCVAGVAALVLESRPDLNQSEMEAILELGASGLPLPASDAWVPSILNAAGGTYETWDGGDSGSGFLQADDALFFARLRR